MPPPVTPAQTQRRTCGDRANPEQMQTRDTSERQKTTLYWVQIRGKTQGSLDGRKTVWNTTKGARFRCKDLMTKKTKTLPRKRGSHSSTIQRWSSGAAALNPPPITSLRCTLSPVMNQAAMLPSGQNPEQLENTKKARKPSNVLEPNSALCYP